MITITANAAEQIRNSAKQGRMEGMPLRIAAKRGQDGSIQYGMGFDDAAKEDDHRFSSEGIELVVAPASINLLEGTVLDFVELDSGEQEFVFMNPNDPNYQPPSGGTNE